MAETMLWSPLRKIAFKGMVSVPEEDQVLALRTDLMTVYYPGFSSSRSQAAKYVAYGDGVPVLKEDESGVLYTARVRGAPRLLHNVFPAREPPELTRGWTLNPISWVQFGLDLGRTKVLSIEGTPVSCMTLTKVNLGGKMDQAECLRVIGQAVAVAKVSVERKRIVLFGTSRGAATILSAALQLSPELAEWIALVICEAPFDSVYNVVTRTSWFPKATLSLLRSLGTVEADGVHPDPLQVISTLHPEKPIPIRCPFVFVSSEADSRVPVAHVDNAVKALRTAQPQLEILTLQLKASHHSLFSMHNDNDQQRYLQLLKEVYNKIPVDDLDR